MIEQLRSNAELNAEKAENLRTFSGLKLLHIKKQVEKLLSHIGDYGFFIEYTKHDISHIEEMLKIVEWLIPGQTQDVMTPAEWMMLVLSIYFHDMGMLITKDEFDNRGASDFSDYKKDVYNLKYGRDYLQKTQSLGEKEDVFLYQEYVRKNHAKRIRMWISGEPEGNAELVGEIQKLLSPLDDLFRQDLAMICESHHLNNLRDYSVYDTNRCYESADESKVNLQYVAVMLRTADLLHITMDRTPVIEYNAFCPTDPISILEWQKQKAVRAVRPMEMRDDDGNVDKDRQSDKISITAHFETVNQAEAFFALMDYLRYVKQELKYCYEIVQDAAKREGTSDYVFPWKDIDDSKIFTKKFSKKLLSFELAQNNILQLLVGNTLYNDSSVVLRELVQNGLDAIKLQNEIERDDKKELTQGKIIVNWDSSKRILTFEDNGTGMTIDDIENYLLKVGRSKYSSSNFKEKYPDFVSISRFGIGILTCFLVANDIEIMTCSSENSESNRIVFRNVDGRYLLKSLEKQELPKHIAEHGTVIKLHLRDNADMQNIEHNIKKWIVFPYCEVVLIKDNEIPIKIGYSSPKAALEEYISHEVLGKSDDIIIKQEEIEGITIAYVMKYKEYFQEYSLVSYSRRNYMAEEEHMPIPIGVCFEGIRVSSNTPGYCGDAFLAIMNSCGSNFVKTDVVRSSIEDNEGKDKLLRIIYGVYKKYVEEQIETFKKKGRSMSWIAYETKFLIRQMVGLQNGRMREVRIEKEELMSEVFGGINAILFENENERKLVSANTLQKCKTINMSESNMIDAAEHLLKEAKSSISLSGLVNTITNEQTIKGENLLCDYEPNSLLHTIALKRKHIKKVVLNKDERKIDLSFEEGEERWIKVALIKDKSYDDYEYAFIPINGEKVQGIGIELGVKTRLGVFLNSNHEVTKYLCEKISMFDYKNSNIDMYAFRLFVSLVVNKQNTYISRDISLDYFEKYFQNRIEHEILDRVSEDIKEVFWEKIDRNELIALLKNQKIVVYDLKDWLR